LSITRLGRDKQIVRRNRFKKYFKNGNTVK
jgi:hypothetical protein